jgi:hypothetical protein
MHLRESSLSNLSTRPTAMRRLLLEGTFMVRPATLAAAPGRTGHRRCKADDNLHTQLQHSSCPFHQYPMEKRYEYELARRRPGSA